MKLPFVSIFNTTIHSVSLSVVLRYIGQAAGGKKPLIVFPINIHILVELIKNPLLLKEHNAADIVFADGVPLVWLSGLKKPHTLSRVSGTLLTEKILREYNKIFLIAPTTQILEKIIAKYNTKTRKITGGYCPPDKESWGDRVNRQIIDRINKTKSRIVLVGVGPLKQERWILENAVKTQAEVFVAVGSAFDILSGEKPRSPLWMQKAGLEWIWRILLEPKRLCPRYMKDVWFFLKLIFSSCAHYVAQSNQILFGFIILNILFAVFLVRQYPQQAVGYRANRERTGVYRSRPFAQTPQWWRFKTEGLLTCAPVIVNGKIYISSWEDFTLYVLDSVSGKLLWKYTADNDVPFSPTVFRNMVYIGSVDGHMYALDGKTGELKWKFASDKLKSITTHPFVYNSMVIFGSRDGYMYSLDWQTGIMKWSFQSENIDDNTPLRLAWSGQNGNYIESSPLVHNGVLYFGSFNGKLYGINAQTGKPVLEYQTEGAIVSSPSVSGNTLVIGSEDTYVYAFRLSDKKPLWKTGTDGSIDATPAISNDIVIINSLNNTLYALSLSSGKILWTKTLGTASHSGAAIDGNTVYFGSSDNSLYAIDLATGTTKWTYSAGLPINAAPSLSGNTIYFTSGWYVYALNKHTGKPFVDISRTTAVHAPTKATLYEPVEFSLTHNEQLYQNPWNEASISAVFISPSNKAIAIDGFYYDHNQWRIRFAPNETGEWRWSLIIRPVPSSEKAFNGLFTVDPSDNPGFLRIDATNPFHFVFDNGSPFYPLGIGDTMIDYNGNGYPFDDFGVDEKLNITLDQYAKIYGKDGAGFNIFRWSVDNASFKLYDMLYSPLSKKSARWDTYPVKNGLWGDELVRTFKNNGFRIWMTIWGFNPNASTEKPEIIYAQTSIEAYLRYVVARYGAYVDVWELGNEALASDLWISYVTTLLASIDPYHHPISMNWEMPEQPGIAITSPHWYHNEALSESDITMANKIYQYKQWQKPIVFGEEGNKYVNWDETSGTRMRVRTWTAFFNDASLIFWNSSATKSFISEKNANIYLGPDERRYVRVFQNTIRDLTTGYTRETLSLNGYGIRYYAVTSGSQLLAYFFHYSNPNQKTSAQVSLYRVADGTMQFINPENGDVLYAADVAAGWNTLTLPHFTCDVVLKIR